MTSFSTIVGFDDRRFQERDLAMLRTVRNVGRFDLAGHALGDKVAGLVDIDTPPWKAGMRYKADITGGSLKLSESRRIADLLLRSVDAQGWNDAIVKQNVLQARTPATARRLTQLIRGRLETMGPELWTLVRDGKGLVATHALFAAAVKHSPLLGDFLFMVVGEQYRRFGVALSNKMFAEYLEGCRERDREMPHWNDSTRARLRSSVFQMLAQAGYIDDTKSLRLRTVHIADEVLRYLKANHEDYVIRCIRVSP